MRRQRPKRQRNRLLLRTVVILLLLLLLNYVLSIGLTQFLQQPNVAYSLTFSNLTENRRLLHVISPFHDKSSDGLFQPLNSEQWSALVSIERARAEFLKQRKNNDAYHHPHLSFDEILVVCAVLQSDIGSLNGTIFGYCDRVVPLSKSTATEYHMEQALPFLQEIMEESTGLENRNDFYWMITNADISVTRNFYSVQEHELRNRKAMALSINRMSIDLDAKLTLTEHSVYDEVIRLLDRVDDMVKTNNYQKHPGFDCFIIHSSVLQMIHFGDLFLGYPPWGSNIDVALRIMAKNYANIKSNRNGTFHVGNDRSWQAVTRTKTSDKSSFWKDKVDELHYLPWCPISNHPPPNEYILQNNINCGKWFRPKLRWNRWSQNGIPSFVRPEFEHVYIQNVGPILNFTKGGMPLIEGQPTPRRKQRIPIPTTRLSRLFAYISDAGALKKAAN